MKWYLLTTVFYASCWLFVGWGLQVDLWIMILSLGVFLTCALAIYFHFDQPVVKESLMLLNLPGLTVFAILKNWDDFGTWRIVACALALLLQGALITAYFWAKKKRKDGR